MALPNAFGGWCLWVRNTSCRGPLVVVQLRAVLVYSSSADVLATERKSVVLIVAPSAFKKSIKYVESEIVVELASNLQFPCIRTEIACHFGEILAWILVGLSTLDAILEMLKSINGGGADELNHAEELA